MLAPALDQDRSWEASPEAWRPKPRSSATFLDTQLTQPIFHDLRTTHFDSFVEAPLSRYQEEQLARSRLQQEIRDAVTERLNALVHDLSDEDRSVNPTSRKDFLNFVHATPFASKPAIAILENGNVRALWREPAGGQVGLQFLGEQIIQFVIIYADRRFHASGRTHLSNMRSEHGFGALRKVVLA